MNLLFFKFSAFFLLFCSLFPLKVQGQNEPQLNWGKQVKNNTNIKITKIISQDATGFYTIKTKQGKLDADGPDKVYIEHYNREMDLTKSLEIDLKWKKKRRQFEKVLMIGGQLYLFTSFNNQAKKKNFLFAQRLNRKLLKPEKELTFIAEIDTKNKYKEGSFHFHISLDSSKVLIYNQLPYKKKSIRALCFTSIQQ